MTVSTPVLAAGAVCWREVDGHARILLVHRAAHADVSLPKGKLDPGETLPQTAKREIQEETGLTVTLGANLGTIDYTLPSGREKVVYYWAAEVADHALELSKFAPNNEIASLEWVSLAKARKKVSYSHDVEIIDRFAELFEARRARTFAIIALRHGKTVPGEAWDGPDSTRPLMQRGNDQARSIASGIAAYAPLKIISSTAARCLSTVAPLAGFLALPVKESAGISQDAHESGESTIERVVHKRIAKRVTAVLCSHAPVVPEILMEIARQTNSPTDATLRHAAMLSPSEYSVIHLSVDNPSSGIVAIESHGPANG